MTNSPVDLEAHRALASQRLEVLRRKQLQQLRADLNEIKAQQATFEKHLLEAIADNEIHIVGGHSSTQNSPAGSLPTRMNGRPTDRDAAKVSLTSNGVTFQAESPGNTWTPSRRQGKAKADGVPRQHFSKAPCESKEETAAIVYCEANFGEVDGKTANGLVRHSEKYRVIAIIDSRHCGKDAGIVLDGIPNGIPICRDLADAIACVEGMPSYFIYGMAPSSGLLSQCEREVVLDAMGLGMDIVSGLHEFLSDDNQLFNASCHIPEGSLAVSRTALA